MCRRVTCITDNKRIITYKYSLLSRMLQSTSNDLPKNPNTSSSLTSINELSDLRAQSCLRLKSAWESIIERYGRDLDNEADEIDLMTEKVVVDRGFVRNAKIVKVGSLIWGWGLTDEKPCAEHEPAEREYDERKYNEQKYSEVKHDKGRVNKEVFDEDELNDENYKYKDKKDELEYGEAKDHREPWEEGVEYTEVNNEAMKYYEAEHREEFKEDDIFRRKNFEISTRHTPKKRKNTSTTLLHSSLPSRQFPPSRFTELEIFRTNAELWCLPDEQFSTPLRPISINHNIISSTSSSSTPYTTKTYKSNVSTNSSIPDEQFSTPLRPISMNHNITLSTSSSSTPYTTKSCKSNVSSANSSIPDEQFSTPPRMSMNHNITLSTSSSSTPYTTKSCKSNLSSTNSLIPTKKKAPKVRDRLRKKLDLMDWESSESVTVSSQEEEDDTRWMATKCLKRKWSCKEETITSRKKQEVRKKKKKEQEEAEWQSAIEKGIIYLPEGPESPPQEEMKNKDTPRKKGIPERNIEGSYESRQGAIVGEKIPLVKDGENLTENLPPNTPIPNRNKEINLIDEKLDEFGAVFSPENIEERLNFINLESEEEEEKEEKEGREREILTESNSTIASLPQFFGRCGGPGICQKTFCFSCSKASDGIFLMV